MPLIQSADTAPFDAYFDSVMMMAPLYCLRGTEDGLWFFQEAYKEMQQRADNHEGPLPKENFRVVMEGASAVAIFAAIPGHV